MHSHIRVTCSKKKVINGRYKKETDDTILEKSYCDLRTYNITILEKILENFKLQNYSTACETDSCDFHFLLLFFLFYH